MTLNSTLAGRSPTRCCHSALPGATMSLLLTVAATGAAGALAPSSRSAAPGAVDVPSSIRVIPTAAHLVGLNGTNWRTDLQLQNPSSEAAALDVTLLPRDQDNSSPASTVHLTVQPGQSVRYPDALQLLFGYSGAAAIRVDTTADSLLVTSRTYNQRLRGSFGAIVAPATAIAAGHDGRLIGLSHDPSLTAGSRTNVGLVNATAAAARVQLELYSGDGTLLGTSTHDLEPFEYIQLDKVFETVSQDRIDDGFAIVRSYTVGASFFAFASVVDNVTGDGDYAPVLSAAATSGVSGEWLGSFKASSIACESEPAEVAITVQGQTVAGVISSAPGGCGPTNGVIAGTLDSTNAFHGTVSQGGSSGTINGSLQPGSVLRVNTGSMLAGEQVTFSGGDWQFQRKGPWDY
jgi:hypothetical protein